ncbi:hypothetical protein HYT05_04150 [Candidatus Kaiserbacteria bacterium]|nr:hypothetical protein [Candidatus Kaiserbacteria bacterium]
MTTTTEGFVALDTTGEKWENVVDGLLSLDFRIIALRGAGSFNGISKANANRIVAQHLVPRLEKSVRTGHTAVIFDGDNDDLAYPDIGYIMGRLRDQFCDWAAFYAVQMLPWYKYRDELPAMRPLHTASYNEYRTYLFPEKTFVGDHDHFSQHARLVRTPRYEQWYIGACGLIASKQLADYSAKVSGAEGEHRAVIFRASVSVEQEQKILRKLQEETDPERSARLRESLARRAENPFGLLCTPEGEFISKPEYANLRIEVI